MCLQALFPLPFPFLAIFFPRQTACSQARSGVSNAPPWQVKPKGDCETMRDREGQCLHKIRLSKGTEGKNSRYIGRIRGGQNSLSYFPALISIALLFTGFAQICFLVNSLITSLELPSWHVVLHWLKLRLKCLLWPTSRLRKRITTTEIISYLKTLAEIADRTKIWSIRLCHSWNHVITRN